VFLRGNSSDNPSHLSSLESVRQHRGLLIAAFAAMFASAAATGGYARLVGPPMQSFEANSALGDPDGGFNSGSLWVHWIVGAPVLPRTLRVLAETVRVHLTAKAQLGIVR